MLSDVERRFLAEQRIAHLATADRRAAPHVVPVCFAVLERTLYITVDEKPKRRPGAARSEEHTSELQSRPHLVCRLLLEKKKKNKFTIPVLNKKKKITR